MTLKEQARKAAERIVGNAECATQFEFHNNEGYRDTILLNVEAGLIQFALFLSTWTRCDSGKLPPPSKINPAVSVSVEVYCPQRSEDYRFYMARYWYAKGPVEGYWADCPEPTYWRLPLPPEDTQ